MTHTSSRPDAFRRTFVSIVAVLTLVCAVLVAVSAVIGPRVESVSVDAQQVVLGAGQLRFFANEQLGEGASVTVNPAAGASVAVSANVLSVQFDRPLAYGTEYTVTATHVTNTSDAAAATFTHTFTTGDPALYYLTRSPAGDEILSTSVRVSDEAPRVVYRADRIEQFVRCGDLLVVATDAADGTSALTLVSPSDGATENLALPAVGTLDTLQSYGSTIGFTFTTTDDEYDPTINHQLFTLDLAASSRDVVPATGISGQPLGAQNWRFVAGTTTVIVHDLDSNLVSLDLATGAILPLGQVSSFDGISTDATAITVTDQLGLQRIDLADLARTPVQPSPVGGRKVLGGAASLLRDGLRTQVVAVENAQTGRFDSYIVRDNGTTATPIYQTVNHEGRIVDSYPSPNDQYLAIEVEPNVSDSVSDRYPINPRSTTITTVIVNIASGRLVRSVNGFDVSWP